jgi:hypothetical protein
MDFVTLDAVAWLNISSSFVLGDKICRFRKDTSKTDRGDPNLFKDLVKYWMAFQIVQVLHEYGLNPGFNDELEEWSSDLYSIVQLISKNQQSKVDARRAESCIKILFDGNKTEHWGCLLRCDVGTQLAFKRMNNFALPLVVMSWHRMVLEFFSSNADYTFFDLGNYSETQGQGKKEAYGDAMYLETIKEKKRTRIDNFDCFRPNKALENSPDVCLSLVEWARHILVPVVETNEQKQKRVQWLQDRQMKSYAISTKVINWKADLEKTQTIVEPSTAVATTLSSEDVHDTSVLMKNIGLSLIAAERTIDSIPRKNADRKEDDKKVQLGIMSFVQCIKNNEKTGGVHNMATALGWLEDNKTTLSITDNEASVHGGSNRDDNPAQGDGGRTANDEGHESEGGDIEDDDDSEVQMSDNESEKSYGIFGVEDSTKEKEDDDEVAVDEDIDNTDSIFDVAGQRNEGEEKEEREGTIEGSQEQDDGERENETEGRNNPPEKKGKRKVIESDTDNEEGNKNKKIKKKKKKDE